MPEFTPAQRTDAAHANFRSVRFSYQEALERRRDAIRDEHAAGTSMYAIAKRLGITQNAVATIIKSAPVPERHRS